MSTKVERARSEFQRALAEFSNPVEFYAATYRDVRRELDLRWKGLTEEEQRHAALLLDRELASNSTFYFFTHHCHTIDNREVKEGEGQIKLLPADECTRIECELYERFNHIAMVKFRQGGETWKAMARMLHKGNFRANRNIFVRSLTLPKAGFGGSGEPDPRTLLGRLWIMYSMLPPHIQTPAIRQNREPCKAVFSHFSKNGRSMPSNVYAISSDESSMMGEIPTDVFVDEFSEDPHLAMFMAKMRPSVGPHGTIACVGNPNGRNEAYNIIYDQQDTGVLTTDEQAPFVELMPDQRFWRGKVLEEVQADRTNIPLGPRFHARLNTNNGFLSIKLYWRSRMDWLKGTPEYDHIMSLPAWVRQKYYENSFDAEPGRLAAWISSTRHEQADLKPDPHATIYVCIDPGKHASTLFIQPVQMHSHGTPWVQVRILHEIDRSDLKWTDFGAFINFERERRFGNQGLNFQYICDVAGSQTDYQTRLTAIESLLTHNKIMVNYSRKFGRREGMDTIARKFEEFVGGEPAMLIDIKNCRNFGEALRSGIPMKDDGTLLDAKHCDPWVHASDLLRYFSCWILRDSDITTGKLVMPTPNAPPLSREEMLKHIRQVMQQDAEANIKRQWRERRTGGKAAFWPTSRGRSSANVGQGF